MKIVPLSARPDAIPVIAAWYYEEWGSLNPGLNASAIAQELKVYSENTHLPQVVLVVNGPEIVAAAEINLFQVKLFPDYEHWLKGVYVAPERRNKGVASKLIKATIEVARSYNVSELYLQTERLDGGIYAKHGWVAMQQFEHRGINGLLMKLSLKSRIV